MEGCVAHLEPVGSGCPQRRAAPCPALPRHHRLRSCPDPAFAYSTSVCERLPQTVLCMFHRLIRSAVRSAPSRFTVITVVSVMNVWIGFNAFAQTPPAPPAAQTPPAPPAANATRAQGHCKTCCRCSETCGSVQPPTGPATRGRPAPVHLFSMDEILPERAAGRRRARLLHREGWSGRIRAPDRGCCSDRARK